MNEQERRQEEREQQIIDLVKKNKELLSVSEGVRLEINIKGQSIIGKVTVGLKE